MGSSSSTPKPEDAAVVEAKTKHTATVIFLHGLGDTGDSWSEAFTKIRVPHVKYICPTANTIPVTINGRAKMPAWFDIRGFDPSSTQDEDGIRSSAQFLQTLIANEEKLGISRERIIIGGFSQGGSVALYSAFTYAQKPVAGILALSTWLPLHYNFPSVLKANESTPILQCHGASDPIVPYSFGMMTSQMIRQFNPRLELKSYKNMGHCACDEEMQDVEKFILKLLPAT